MEVSAFDCAEARMIVTEADGDDTNGYSLSMVQYGDESETSVLFTKNQGFSRFSERKLCESTRYSERIIHFNYLIISLLFKIEQITCRCRK